MVLVTGANGFIGRHVVAALVARGVRVRALVREGSAPALEALGAEVAVGDLTAPHTAARATVGVRTVFHLAGRLFVPGRRSAEYEDLHVRAAARLFEASMAGGDLAAFVLCSTTGVHGPTGESAAREDAPGRPLNIYEITKAKGEQVARDIARTRRAPLVIARPGLVYGPGDLHLAGWFRAIQGGYYRVVGLGTNHLHPIYIDDCVRGILRCAEHASPEGRAYHLVGRQAVTMRELSDAIGAAVGRRVPARHVPAALAYAAGAFLECLPIARRKLPLSRTRVTFLTQNRAYDGTRARDELGFAPQVDLPDGLARTVAWYRQSGLL